MADPTTPQPARVLGLWLCLALVVGNIIGTGIFLLPAALAPYGWNALFGWPVAIAGGLCLAYVFAGLARSMPQADGPYHYIRAAFGPAAAFFVMWSYWIALWVGNAAIAIGAVSYLGPFAPGFFSRPGAGPLTAIGFVVILTFIATRGVRVSGGVQLSTSILKLLPLIAVIVTAVVVFGGGTGGWEVMTAPTPVSIAGIAGAATLALFAMGGFESATIPASRVHRPERTIPRATLIGTLFVGLVYLLVSTSVLLLLPAEQAARSNAPLAELVAIYWGGGAASLVAGFAAISALGALNGWVLLQAEVPLALARSGVFPKLFGYVNRAGMPIAGHAVGCILSCSLIATNVSHGMAEIFAFMALLAMVANLTIYLAAALAALALRRAGAARGRRLTAAATAGALFALWSFYGAGAEATGWGAVLLASGIPVYFLMRARGRSSPAAAANPAAPPGSAA